MGETPLYQAVDMDKIDHVKLLFKFKADPNISQTDGLTPLHTAVTKQNANIVECLLSNGANPNLKSKCFGQTPVHLAIKNNVNPTILLLLVQYNGSLVIKDKTDKRPIDYVNSDEMRETLKKLRLKRENIFKTPKKERSMSFATPNNGDSLTKQLFPKASGDFGYKNIDIYSNTVLKEPGSAIVDIIECKSNCNSEMKRGCFSNTKIQKSAEQVFLSSKKVNNNDINHLKRALFSDDNNNKENIDSNIIPSHPTSNSNNNVHSNNNNQKYGTPYTSEKNYRDTRYSPIEEMKEEELNDKSSNSASNQKTLRKDNDASESKNANLNETNSNNKQYDEINSLQILSYNDAMIKDSSNSLSPNDKNVNSLYKSKINKEKEFTFELNTFSKNDACSQQSELKYKKTNKKSDQSFLKQNLFDTNYQNDSVFNDQCSINTTNTALFANKSNKHSNHSTSNKHKKTATLSSDFNTYHSQGETNKKEQIIKSSSNSQQQQQQQPLPQYTSNTNKPFGTFTASTINHNTYTSNNTTTNIDFNINNTITNTTNTNINNIETIYYATLENSKYGSSYGMGSYACKLTPIDSTKLYEWLREINLLCYYPLFIEKGIYVLDRIICDMKEEKIKLTYSDIEDIGIKKPGHVYRILIKLEVDAGLISEKIYEFIMQTKIESSLKNSTDVMYSKEYVCGCNIANQRTIVKNKKHYDLVSWLKNIGQTNKKDNFLYNGFEMIEFFILQMFSSIPIDDAILQSCLHIYSEKDRDIIIMQLNRDIRFIIKKVSGKYNSLDMKREEEETSCKVCTIF